MLAGRTPLVFFFRWFQLFVSFIWCQLFACIVIKAAIFRLLATSICSLVFLSLPQAFVICFFFLCHRHLCTVSFFHGLFCWRHSCVRLSVYALLYHGPIYHGCIVYTDYVYPAFVALLTDWFPASSFFSESLFVFLPLFHHTLYIYVFKYLCPWLVGHFVSTYRGC